MSKLFRHLLGCIYVLTPPPQTSTSVLLKNLSTLAETGSVSRIDRHLQNPFAEFAATKFNLSSANIVLMFKRAPWLERLQTLDKVEQFVDMLNKHGFKQHQIAKIMMTMPTHLTSSVEKVVQPKLQLFKEWGIQGEHLSNVLTKSPRILTASVEQDLLPKMMLLQKVFQSRDLFIEAVLKTPIILTYNLEKTLKPSLVFWEGHGFSGMKLAKLMLSRPSLLQYSSLTPAKVDFIHKIGTDKGSEMYEYVIITLLTSPMEGLEAKMHNLRQCGLSAEEGFELLRVFPKTLGLSKETVREKMDFIVNTMELPANSVVSYPQFLTTNLERVLKPRFLVWRTMKSMYGRRHLKGMSLHGIMFMSEKKFLNDIVKGRPVLYSVYEMAMANVSEVSSKG